MSDQFKVLNPAKDQQPVKPGYQTTEFWVSIVSAAIGLLITSGLIPTSDASFISESATKIMGGLVAAVAVYKYIHARAIVKSSAVLLAVLFLGQTVQAQCMLPWRSQVERRLQALESGQKQQPQAPQQPIIIQQPSPAPSPAPAPQPQLIVLGPHFQPQYPPSGGPLQQLPISGQPIQSLPIQGLPIQSLPIQGSPIQSLPIQGQPIQQMPIGGLPIQQLPLQSAPPQQSLPSTPQLLPLPQGQPQAPIQGLPLGGQPQTIPSPIGGLQIQIAPPSGPLQALPIPGQPFQVIPQTTPQPFTPAPQGAPAAPAPAAPLMPRQSLPGGNPGYQRLTRFVYATWPKE